MPERVRKPGWTKHLNRCIEPGCDRPRSGNGLCNAHYQRSKYEPRVRQLPQPREACTHPGCTDIQAHLGRGLCKLHNSRFVMGYDMDRPHKQTIMYAGDDITYHAAHCRLAALWGSASQYPCIQCGKQAKDWAYDGTDPTQRYGTTSRGSWLFYSAWPEFYMPMCRKCHLKRDRVVATNELREYRRLKHETGLGLDEIYQAIEGFQQVAE